VFFSLVFFTIDTFQSENLFEFISGSTINFIKRSKKEDKKHSKFMKWIHKKSRKVQKTKNTKFEDSILNIKKVNNEFDEELNSKINILFENSISAINNNEFLVNKKILENIPKITKAYLEETKDFFIKGDEKFAYNLNDNYNFVFRAIKNNYNEKLFEDLVYSISRTSLEFLKNKELIGYDSGYSIHFLTSLENFFYETFKLKRTSVCHLIIQEISKHILSYDQNYNNRHNPYTYYLEGIESFLKLIIELENKNKGVKIEESHDYWANLLYRNIINTKKQRFFIFLNNTKKFKYVDNDLYIIKNYFKDFSDKFLEIKKSSKSLNIIYPCLYGLDSFAIQIASLNFSKLNNDVQRINLNNYLIEYLEFNKKIILNLFERNDSFVYKFYPEFIFYIMNYADLKKEHKEKLIEETFNIVIENINLVINKEKIEETNGSFLHRNYFESELEGKLIDSMAILFYSYDEHKEVIKNILVKILELYSKLSREKKDEVFSTLKLIGCWINYLIKVNKSLIKEYNNKIKDDLRILSREREDIIYKGIGTVFQEFGYFNNSFTLYQDGFWLRPSYMWGNEFQDKISKFFNFDLTIYEKYHKKLKKLKEN